MIGKIKNKLVTGTHHMSTFQKDIEWLLKTHNILEAFQNQTTFHVRFDMSGFDRLVVERHGSLISVAHYFEQNGDLIADPEIELHYPSWFPTAITQVWSGRRKKFIERDGAEYVDVNFHDEVTSFLVVWGRNIRSQGWDKASSSNISILKTVVE
jgi:hypothetical protein